MPEDFENEILVKDKAAELLDLRLTRARTLLPDVIVLGGVTDPYQGAEKKFANTRQILEVIARHRYAAHVITKSTLVERDAALLNQIGEQSWSSVSITITTVDTNVANFLDFRAPSPQRRLETIRRLKQKSEHFQVGVLLIPIVPFLADSDEALAAVYQAAKAAGADYVQFGGGMTMRDVQAEWFLKHLEESFPELLPKYAELYQFDPEASQYDGLYIPPDHYLRPLYQKLLELSKQYELPWHMPRYLPADFRYLNYRIAGYLLNRSRLRQMIGGDWQQLHWAGQAIQNLKESIIAVASRGELATIPNVHGPLRAEVEMLIQRGKLDGETAD